MQYFPICQICLQEHPPPHLLGNTSLKVLKEGSFGTQFEKASYLHIFYISIYSMEFKALLFDWDDYLYQVWNPTKIGII